MLKGNTSFRDLPPQFRRRLNHSLERQRSSRSPRGKLLVSCDQVTGAYFSGLIQHLELSDRVTLCSCPEQGPVTIVKSALQTLETKGPFQRVYALVCHDGRHDGKEKAAWHQAHAMVSSHNLENNTLFRLVTSVPSFDLWLLLHWVDASLECEDGQALATRVHNRLDQHLPTEKTFGKDFKLFECLHPGLTDAIRRSQTLSRRNSIATTIVPVTEVHEVVSFLLRWKNRLQS